MESRKLGGELAEGAQTPLGERKGSERPGGGGVLGMAPINLERSEQMVGLEEPEGLGDAGEEGRCCSKVDLAVQRRINVEM